MKKFALLFSFVIPLLCSNLSSQNTPPLGMNLAGLCDWDNEIPFQDQFMLARAWISQVNGGGWGTGPTPLNVDSNGYVKSLASATDYVTTVIQNGVPDMPVGLYHFYYEGKGTFRFWGVSGITTTVIDSNTNVEVNVPSVGSIFLDITSTDRTRKETI